jgi:hypothetical protein
MSVTIATHASSVHCMVSPIMDDGHRRGWLCVGVLGYFGIAIGITAVVFSGEANWFTCILGAVAFILGFDAAAKLRRALRS